MKKWTKLRIDKIILKNLTTLSFVFVSLTWTLGFYLLFLNSYGTDMKIYDVGVLAGATGAIWGYAMTKLSNFRDKVHNMNEKEFYAPSFYKRLLIINIILIVIMPFLGVFIRGILEQY